MALNPLRRTTGTSRSTEDSDSGTDVPEDDIATAVGLLGGSTASKMVAGPAVRVVWRLARRHPKIAVMLVVFGAVGTVAYKKYWADDPATSRSAVVDDIPSIDRRQPV